MLSRDNYQEIMVYCDITTLKNLALTCHRLYELVRDRIFRYNVNRALTREFTRMKSQLCMDNEEYLFLGGDSAFNLYLYYGSLRVLLRPTNISSFSDHELFLMTSRDYGFCGRCHRWILNHQRICIKCHQDLQCDHHDSSAYDQRTRRFEIINEEELKELARRGE